MTAAGHVVEATVMSSMDTIGVLRRVLGPVVAQGAIIRRPAVTGWAARNDWDGRAVRFLSELRRRYGEGPLLLRIPRRRIALVLDADDVGRMLAETPEPFAAVTTEKRAALRHFEPDGVLISTGDLRRRRRAFNESVLDTGHRTHRLAGPITRIVWEEFGPLAHRPTLDWTTFADAHARTVRRVVLGDPARDDRGLTDLLDRLRRRANWAYAMPTDRRGRRELHRRIESYLTHPAPDSLASVIAETPADDDVRPAGQVPQWLFAFDALGATALRALALMAADPGLRASAGDELGPQPSYRPHLSATILETVRLWPTTLVVLRETTTATHWRGRVLPAGTTLVALSSLFHRDPGRGASADRPARPAWLDATADRDPGTLPFSAGPARCPGRDLVTFTGATILAALLSGSSLHLGQPRLDPRRLPAALDHFGIRLRRG